MSSQTIAPDKEIFEAVETSSGCAHKIEVFENVDASIQKIKV